MFRSKLSSMLAIVAMVLLVAPISGLTTQEAAAQGAVRCPCFNEMLIAGACRQKDSCEAPPVFDPDHLSCTEAVGGGVEGWSVSTTAEPTYSCTLTKLTPAGSITVKMGQPHRKDVAARREGPLQDLLRRHVANRSERLLAGVRGRVLRVEGDADFAEDGDAVGCQQDARRLDVAVDHVSGVERREGRERVVGAAADLQQGQHATVDPRGFALDEP